MFTAGGSLGDLPGREIKGKWFYMEAISGIRSVQNEILTNVIVRNKSNYTKMCILLCLEVYSGSVLFC